MEKWAVLLAVSLLLLGCALPGWERGNSSITEIPPVVIPANNSSVIPLPQNGTGGNATAGNHSGQLLIPRNISGNIGEGQFDIPDPSGEPMRIRVMSAGNSDSILINKGEFYMLIDDGDPQLVTPYLKSLGIGRLDVVVASKDSPEAIGGIGSLVGEFYIGELWDNGWAGGSAEYAAMRKKAWDSGAAAKYPRAGDLMEIGEFKVYVLNPRDGLPNANPDNNAIVLKVTNGEFCMVLLNPIVQDWENSIIGSAGNESLQCDVMTYFKRGEARPMPPVIMERIAPRDVIISVGPNSNGLPSPTTLERLELAEKVVWRTDLNGTITIVNYGNPAYEIIPGIATSAE